MKTLLIMINIFVLLSLTLYSSCDKAEAVVDILPTEQELFVIDISKTWDISNQGSITKDGVDITSQFPDFTLTFGNKTYSSSGGLNLWLDGSGTWDFANAETTTPIILEGITMDVTLSSSSVALSFTLGSTPIGGRNSSVSGNYIITGF